MLSTKLKEAAGNSADATLYVDDVFSTWLYTGTGAVQTITNGIDLAGKGGLVWRKGRAGTYSADWHSLVDTARGATKAVFSNTTDAEITGGVAWPLTSFNADGFTIPQGEPGGGQPAGYPLNFLNTTYASWTFRKAAKFFDVVTYTGNGVAGTAIPHNLGIPPGMVIVKPYSTTGNWPTQHRSLGNNGYLNSTSNFTEANFTPGGFSSTSFSISGSGQVNTPGELYVAYVFAHDTSSTGIIQCGNYTGNGSATGRVVTLGWEPQYLMIKNASGTGNWQVIDSMRGMPVGSADATLQPNLANAESSVEYLSPTATGFQITSTSTEVNTNGSTYIYMAIRRPNKPPTSGTQVYNAVSYAGNGTTRTLATGITTDLALTGNTNAGGIYSRFFTTSRLQGNGFMSTIATSAEAVSATIIPTDTFTSAQAGVKIGSANPINSSSYNFINWSFKRAPGFFDVVCYTGTGSATTQAHNLGVVPELVIVKCRTASGDILDWRVTSSVATPSGFGLAFKLNTTELYGINGGYLSSVTSSSMTINVNFSTPTQTYVAYLFATLAGISKVGSYTGNGTGQAIACGFSAGARFVLIKRTDSTGDWYTFDSARGLTSGSSPYLLLNSTAAEVTGNNGVYASTGGFTLGSTASTTTNINGASYIYLSVA